jgi:predicted PurR-regulated permease PerM
VVRWAGVGAVAEARDVSHPPNASLTHSLPRRPSRRLRSALLVGIHLEASHVVDLLRQHISVLDTVQYTITVIAAGVGNALLVLLLVLYLLAEQSTVAPGSLRAKVDSQIQRYVVIKTAISALQGALAYLVMGTMLNVRLAHLFGVLHMLLNFIPTAGPIVATCE